VTHQYDPERLIALADAITVQNVAEEALLSCSATDEVSDVLQEMRERDIDIYPVKEADTYTRYVVRQDLAVSSGQTTIGDVETKVIGVADVIPMRSSPREALRLLAVRDWLFCIAGNSVTGIVTRGDLQKVSARMYFFAVVTSFENLALDAIRAAFERDEWAAMSDFPARLLKSAKSEFQKRKRQNEEPSSLADCLMLAGKVAALRRTPLWKESLSPLDAASSGQHDEVSPSGVLDGLVTLRNNLAHGWDLTRGLAGRWAELFSVLDAAHAMMQELRAYRGGSIGE